MLELSNGGITMSGEDAIEFFENVVDMINDDIKTDDFVESYERALNRMRYEIAKSVARKPNVLKAKYKKHGDFYSCSKCGFSLDMSINKYCPNCGTAILKER